MSKQSIRLLVIIALVLVFSAFILISGYPAYNVLSFNYYSLTYNVLNLIATLLNPVIFVVLFVEPDLTTVLLFSSVVIVLKVVGCFFLLRMCDRRKKARR
ncbi:MAG: hypothetical protein K6A95_01645 [Bacteroidales bacterium]|nr:hypothetical protein [Bacteroidales bacterium]